MERQETRVGGGTGGGGAHFLSISSAPSDGFLLQIPGPDSNGSVLKLSRGHQQPTEGV